MNYLLIGLGIVIVFLLGFIVGNFRKIQESLFNFFRNISLPHKYLIFIFLLITFQPFIFKLLKNSFSSESNYNLINLLIQISILIFAIITGYFAFSQIVEDRADKLQEEASREIRNKQYQRAIILSEKALIIQPNSFATLANLLEVYLITEKFGNFDEKKPRLEKNSIETREKIISNYLSAVRYLLTEELGKAKKGLAEITDTIKNNPEITTNLNWNFSDLSSSNLYKKLKGEAKTILENTIKYLSNALSPENKTLFEKNNYTF